MAGWSKKRKVIDIPCYGPFIELRTNVISETDVTVRESLISAYLGKVI